MFTCRSVVLLLLLTAVTAVAQGNGSAGIDPMAGTGAIANNVYTNTYFGFSFQLPSKWKVLLGPDAVAAQGGCAKEQCRILALQAPKGVGRLMMDVKPLAAGTTARDLVTQAGEREQKMGFVPVGAMTEPTSGSFKLFRLDYHIDSGNGEILETLIATEAKGDAILITILSDSRGTLDQLASALQAVDVAAAQPKNATK
jgi:hypothetical protein